MSGTCAKCGRPWEPWPLKRPPLCAPRDWAMCIRPDDAKRRGER